MNGVIVTPKRSRKPAGSCRAKWLCASRRRVALSPKSEKAKIADGLGYLCDQLSFLRERAEAHPGLHTCRKLFVADKFHPALFRCPAYGVETHPYCGHGS